jgi:hypothetical protein
MKTLLVLLISGLSFSAHARIGLDSHYGRVTSRGFTYHCTFHNRTSNTLDMKYVVFGFDRGGDSAVYEVQERIDQRVRSGESLTSSVEESGAITVNYCKFLAR